MEKSSHTRAYLLELTNYVRTYPFLTIFMSFTFVLVFTRIWTGIVKVRQQNNTGPLEKKVPILPYWIPYVGHVISFAWSFDDMLAFRRLDLT